eukprot:11594577-Karenia_brevis.AAC.1
MAPKTWKCRACNNVNPWASWNCNACKGGFQYDKKRWTGWVDYGNADNDRPTTSAAAAAAVKPEQTEEAALPSKKLSSMAAMLEAKKMLDKVR